MEALLSWYKPLLCAVVLEMHARKVVAGTVVEACPVWIFPNQILIAKVWGWVKKTGSSGPFRGKE